ncbi:hypothetical protein, partial [Fulvivirga sediminis]
MLIEKETIKEERQKAFLHLYFPALLILLKPPLNSSRKESVLVGGNKLFAVYTMEQIIESDYKREITHSDYSDAHKKIKRGGWSRALNLHITENEMALYNEDVGAKKAFINANDKF